jgi:hypothetical protein
VGSESAARGLIYRDQDAPGRRPGGANIARGGSILRQDVDFTKLVLNLLDSLDAIWVFFSDALDRHGCPALIAWYDRNRD